MFEIQPLQSHHHDKLNTLLSNEKHFVSLSDGFTHILAHHSELVPQARWSVLIDNQFVGCAGYVFATNNPQLAHISIILHPTSRQQRIGSHLYEQLVVATRKHGAQRLLTTIYAHQQDGSRFAAKRGFSEIGRIIAYQLDVASSPQTTAEDINTLVLAQGLHFTSLDHFPQRGLPSRLLSLWNCTRVDQPQHWPYAAYNERQFEQEILLLGEVALPHSFVISTNTQQIVALNLNIPVADDHLLTFYSGVSPDFRGQKLATALKLRLIAHARATGIRYLSAENDTRNIPMRHINQKLGYQPISELITYQCHL